MLLFTCHFLPEEFSVVHWLCFIALFCLGKFCWNKKGEFCSISFIKTWQGIRRGATLPQMFLYPVFSWGLLQKEGICLLKSSSFFTLGRSPSCKRFSLWGIESTSYFPLTKCQKICQSIHSLWEIKHKTLFCFALLFGFGSAIPMIHWAVSLVVTCAAIVFIERIKSKCCISWQSNNWVMLHCLLCTFCAHTTGMLTKCCISGQSNSWVMPLS